MDVTKIALDRERARELYRAYKTHQHYSEPMDWEIQRTYQLIGQGHVVIQALESIKRAGLNEQGLPKLAIGRAMLKECWCIIMTSGRVRFQPEQWYRGKIDCIDFPAGSFGQVPQFREVVGTTPLVPINLRPKRGIENYHILWEAEWKPVPPTDPYLLRRIGKGDLWLVCAAWDLTEVERAAMATRVAATS